MDVDWPIGLSEHSMTNGFFVELWVMLLVLGATVEGEVKTFHLEEVTISDVHAAYLSGVTTATRLVQAYLERIQAYDQAGPKLNVVIFLNPRALEEATALDEHHRATGKFVGPLHGIPVLLKDNVNTKDMPTTGGSLTLAGYTPATDAEITQKLRSAGAIILAKVNLHEFAIWGETVSSMGGQHADFDDVLVRRRAYERGRAQARARPGSFN
jgi:amidase